MNVDIFISIIIPVFNVEDYLERCLDSIFSQNFSYAYEVITIDDASTDKSLKILRDYQLKQPSLIILVHSTNQNLSIARSTGMRAAKGSYIMHIDSDDWILPGFLNTIYSKLTNQPVDVMVFNYKRVDNLGNSLFLNNIKTQLLTTNKKEVATYFLGACWNKIIKKEMAGDLIYGNVPLNSMEDLVYSIEILMKANSILLVPDILYVYFDNLESITRKVKPAEYLSLQINILTELKKIFIKYHSEIYLQSLVYRYVNKFIFYMIANIHFLKVEVQPQFLSALIMQINYKKLLDDQSRSTLKTAIQNKWFCLWQVKKYSGIRAIISISLNSLSSKFK